jgi:hypothetical protein
MTPENTTLSITLPKSLSTAVERVAAAYGISVHEFLLEAAAEKVGSAESAAALIAERRARANIPWAIALLEAGGGEAPRPDDQLDEPELTPSLTPGS